MLLLNRLAGALPQRRFRVRAQRHRAGIGEGQPALPATLDMQKLVLNEIDLRGTIAYIRDHAVITRVR
ncbi:hypothetical protein GCM10009712_10980 [Pseudarthrobacter sulfonivorans]|uniref:hypothetical protein n=1 Tax=Pseudarthrobacter sulfonivorans TaxID=121292 RepID=UPI00168C08CF